MLNAIDESFDSSKMRLDQLTLDIQEAFAPDGEFLDVRLAGSLPEIIQRFPRTFNKIVPTKALMEQMESLIRAITSVIQEG